MKARHHCADPGVQWRASRPSAATPIARLSTRVVHRLPKKLPRDPESRIAVPSRACRPGRRVRGRRSPTVIERLWLDKRGEVVEPTRSSTAATHVVLASGRAAMADCTWPGPAAGHEGGGRSCTITSRGPEFASASAARRRSRGPLASNILGSRRGEWQGTYYSAMEYVACRSLKMIGREHGALEPSPGDDIGADPPARGALRHRRSA